MAMHAKYVGTTFRPSNATLPGNESSDNPLEFDLVPAWGGDVARIKSIVYATTGLVQGGDWSPEIQAAVIAAFDSGAPAFINTITAIRGLTVPAVMALRSGQIPELPVAVDPADGQTRANHDAPIAVTNGVQFSRLAGALMTLALLVAMEIGKLTDKAERDLDPRFFGQPSGSGGKGTARKAKGSTAKTARPKSRRRETAGNDSTATGT